MIEINNKVDCCGCNACGDICPTDAISFSSDIEGFWYPEVDLAKCINCNLCVKTCPNINIAELKHNDLSESVPYASINENLEIRFDSTSGGIFSAMAEKIYSEGGYVGGAIWDENWGVRHFISSNSKDIEKLRSSKYLQSNLSGFFTEVKNLLNKGETVLVCGTPCQMAGLRRFLRKPYENLIIIDFICRGINSPKAFRKYIDSLEHKYDGKVVYFKAKNKELGWRNLTNKIIFDNGKVCYDTKDKSAFMIAYLKGNVLCRPSCYDCKFKGLPRMSDITIADFWGGEKVLEKGMDNDLGTSLVLVNSKKGIEFWDSIKDNLKYMPLNFESAVRVNQAIFNSLPEPTIDRDSFFKDMDDEDFGKVVDKYFHGGDIALKAKVKNILRFCHGMYYSSGTSVRTWWQNIMYNLFSKKVESDIPRGKYILIRKNSYLRIQSGGKLVLGGLLNFGSKQLFPNSKLETRLLIDSNASLITHGAYGIGYGSNIEVFKNAKLEIDGNGYTNINTTIICGEFIHIGEDVVIGRDVSIRDDNGDHFLAINGYKRTEPVEIGQHVWLCADCKILPGVTIGVGSVIAANATVTKDIPSFTLAGGTPAKPIKKIQWK